MEFANKEALAKALEMNGSKYEGLTLLVNEAGQQPSSGGGAWGGGDFSGPGGARGRSDAEKTVYVRGFDKDEDEGLVSTHFVHYIYSDQFSLANDSAENLRLK